MKGVIDQDEQTTSISGSKVVPFIDSEEQIFAISGPNVVSMYSALKLRTITKEAVQRAKTVPKTLDSARMAAQSSSDRPNTNLGDVSTHSETQTADKTTDQEISIIEPQKRERIIILFWTLMYNSTNLNYNFTTCKYENCFMTFDRSYLAQSRFVIFHMWDLSYHKKRDIPDKRWPEQRWVLFGHESPIYSDFPLYYDVEFNLTFTYKEDADFYYGYGCVSKRPVPVATESLFALSRIGQKTKLVAWVISHCEAQSLRDEYIAELSKYIPVDGYGKCTPNTNRCTPVGKGWNDMASRHSCEFVIRDTYKFFLAFENSLCNGYVTEKVWNKLKYGTVPIVLGASNYTKLLPPNSYIDVKNFTSPKALAKYLQKVDNDDELYKSYFAWRLDYEFKCAPSSCIICDYLNNQNETKVLRNVETWWKDCMDPKDYFRGVADMII